LVAGSKVRIGNLPMVERRVDNTSEPINLDDSGLLAASNRLVQQTLRRLGPTSVNPSALITLLEADPEDTGQIIAAIGMCPALAARVLSVINSAAFGLTRHIDSIERAVLLLGGGRARTVAMAYGLRLLHEVSNLPGDVVDHLWFNSMRKAFAARRMCEIHQPELGEAAYSLGLIQDIGLPMLMAVDFQHYRDHLGAIAPNVRWSHCEQQRFGFDHARVGHGLLREWSAPEHLQKAVLEHHLAPRDMRTSDDAMLKLSTFFAGMMPHLEEEPGSQAVDWIAAIHARFLAEYYPTPDAFFVDIDAQVNKLCGGQNHKRRYDEDRLVRHLSRAVSSNAISVTAKLCRMENLARRHREGIAQLRSQAFTDGLTNVLNRRGFMQLGQHRIDAAVARSAGVCCMLGDLDDFKLMNDNHGHDTGDLVLRGLAKLLRRRLNECDLIGRIGGDEFAVLVCDLTREDAMALAQRLVDSICHKAIRVKSDLELNLRFSLGAIYCHQIEPGAKIDELLRMADQAMYQQKRSGKNGLCFGDDTDTRFVEPPGNPESLTRHGTRSA
jgi:diguanylate cyclase (GGDEF)-like protein